MRTEFGRPTVFQPAREMKPRQVEGLEKNGPVAHLLVDAAGQEASVYYQIFASDDCAVIG